MSALQKITKARAALITGHPFFGSLALRLTLEESGAIPTMATDGVRMLYNPAFVDGLTMPELTGVCAHEVMHCALNHITRAGARDLKQWNVAADHAVNPLLIDAGLTLPKSALIDARFAGKSAEEIYRLLPAPSPQGGQGGQGSPQAGTGQGTQGQTASLGPQNAPSGQTGPGDDPGGCGGILPAPAGQSPAAKAELEQEWTIATVQAANAARAAGRMPGGIARMVDELKAGVVDWREVLRRFIATAAPSDYSWFPPNRRYVAQGLYLPALKPDHIGRIAVFIDTSGSIDDATLAMFAAELNSILEDVQPETVNVLYCDTHISSAEEFEPADYPIKLEAQGGGGTDFRPPFAHLDREGIEPVCAIYLTDLECSSFPQDPGYPVLWASNGRQTAPFGEIVKIGAAS